MGLCQSQEEKTMMAKSKAIDREMVQSYTGQQNVLLGPGECGKSTILKQMRLLHTNGFTDEEINQQKTVVYNNIVQGMASILQGMKKLNIPFENSERDADARVVMDFVKSGNESESLTPALTVALKNLWADKGVCKDAYERGNEFQMPESIAYFMDSIDRVSFPGYRPTEQDILVSQIKTTGIVEVKFKMKNSEREKWIHCFEDVNAIIFLAAISPIIKCFLRTKPGEKFCEKEIITYSHFAKYSSNLFFIF
uniref:G-protein alpha subunit n=1 Tax=Onchocerca volvulus TaxID=6282 RepID=A0A8R1TN34_ONCVO